MSQVRLPPHANVCNLHEPYTYVPCIWSVLYMYVCIIIYTIHTIHFKHAWVYVCIYMYVCTHVCVSNMVVCNFEACTIHEQSLIYMYMYIHVYRTPQCTEEREKKERKRENIHKYTSTSHSLHNSHNGWEILKLHLYVQAHGVSIHNYCVNFNHVCIIF